MLYLGADHNGIALKNALLVSLARRGIAFRDLGPKQKRADDDYPPIATRVANAVAAAHGSYGVLVCGSGNGMAMAANRNRKIRAALAPTVSYAQKAREDENANILVLPAWWLTHSAALRILHAWLQTPFRGEPRHRRRIRQLSRKTNG